MASPTKTRQWLLQNKPHGLPVLEGKDATFKLTTADLPPLSDGQVLLKTLYFSNDPAQRTWISPNADPERLYLPPVDVGSPMRSFALAEVIETKAASHPKGTLVLAVTGWTEHSVHIAADCTPVQPLPGLNITHFLGSLGLPGLTAYYALTEIVKATKDDAIVISGAAGATGSMVVQIAKKMVGCRYVVGIAGSDEKCRWVERLGADVCINYKSPTFEQDLIRVTPGFVEIYYDNVGGRILDLMLKRMKRHGRVAACGAISNYNEDVEPYGLKNYYEVISMRISILGFIVIDYADKLPEATKILTQAWKDGKIVAGDDTETILESTFEDVPKTYLKLYEGSNTGKLTTKLI